MRPLYSFVAGCLLLLAAALVPPPAVNAQGSTDTPRQKQNKSALAVSPAIVEHVLKPGEQRNFKLRVTNLTSFPLPISGTARNFVPLEDIEDPKLQAIYDASKWITISEPDFILQAKQTREVAVTVLPPASAEPGGHYATVYFQPLLPAGALTPATAYLTARVGSLAFMIIPGDFEERLTAVSLKTAGVHQSSPIDLTLNLKNTGSVHLAPDAQIKITDWHGRTVASLPTRPGVALPGTQKAVTATWSEPQAFGRYAARAEITYGTGQTKLMSETVHFWIIPWALLSALAFILISGAVLYFRTRGRWKKAWRILRGKPA